jgi:hypothetical protein
MEANDDVHEGHKSGAPASAEQLSVSLMRRPAVSMLPPSCLSEAEVETSEWCTRLGGGGGLSEQHAVVAGRRHGRFDSSRGWSTSTGNSELNGSHDRGDGVGAANLN